MNKVILIGRITNDLVLKATSTGKSVCDFRIAINRPTTKDGEKIADFINCRVWNKSAENLVRYQAKGNLIAIAGRMQVENYKDKDGNNRNNTYVLVEDLEYLERKKEIVKEAEETKPDLEEKNYIEAIQNFDYDNSELPF